jgi:hypothetical protein
MNAIIPIPRCEVSIRPAVAGDYAFVDRLQDMHTKGLGYMPKQQLEEKIAAGHVLIAEDEMRLPIGYCIATDRYFKRDELGIIYQMNVSPTAQRKLVAASLLKAVFERAAYGCKLFCCWCAQDLDANYFWESMGFLPLAFRTGASGKRTRTHIFWQRRIREGDTTTPYWFPAKTDGGSLREGRLVLPIPPGVHWKDEMPVLLPTAGVPTAGVPTAGVPTAGVPQVATAAETKQLPAPRTRKVNGHDPKDGPITMCRGQFAPLARKSEPAVEKPAVEKKPKRPKATIDPAIVAKARELRDRYLEQFNSGMILPNGKYQVARQIVGWDPATKLIEQFKPQPMLVCDPEQSRTAA